MTLQTTLSTEPTIAAGFAYGLLEFAVSAGGSRDRLLVSSGIAQGLLSDHFNRIPLTGYISLMRAAQCECDDPALALRFGASSRCADLSIVALIGSACETVADALRMLNRYGRLSLDVDGINGNDHFLVRRERDGVWLIENRRYHDVYPELTEATFARFAVGIRAFFGSNTVRAMHFCCDAPSHHAEYEAVVQAPVKFGQARTALLLDPKWYDTRLAPAPKYALSIYTARADALLRELERSRSVAGRVDAILMEILHTGDVSMDRIARALAMSRPTLYRALKAEGITFEQVLNGVRHRVAMTHLTQRKATVSEVSSLVGFSDPAAFSRAFKRWTGVSPRAAASDAGV